MAVSKQRVELEFQRDRYLRLLESAPDADACRKWLRKLDAVNAQLDRPSGAAPDTIVEDRETRGATQPMTVADPDVVPHDDTWLRTGEDWFETIDTSLYQRDPTPDASC